MKKMIVRVRSRDGLERIEIDNPLATVANLRSQIESQLQVPIQLQTLSIDQNLLMAKSLDDLRHFSDMSNQHTLLSSLKLSHGSIVYLAYEGERTVAGAPPVNPAGCFGRKMTLDDLIAKRARVVSGKEINPQTRVVSGKVINPHYAKQIHVSGLKNPDWMKEMDQENPDCMKEMRQEYPDCMKEMHQEIPDCTKQMSVFSPHENPDCTKETGFSRQENPDTKETSVISCQENPDCTKQMSVFSPQENPDCTKETGFSRQENPDFTKETSVISCQENPYCTKEMRVISCEENSDCVTSCQENPRCVKQKRSGHQETHHCAKKMRVISRPENLRCEPISSFDRDCGFQHYVNETLATKFHQGL